MGLKVSTISRLPISTDRDYFIYFLDYGWEEPLTRAMYDNFDKMADIASENRGLIIAGLHRQEFANEVLSWHGVNGEDTADLLPAIMITDTEPRVIANSNKGSQPLRTTEENRGLIKNLIIIPLRDVCHTPSDVSRLLSKIASNMKERKEICDFEVKKIVDKSSTGLAEMIILKPSFAGIGIDLAKAYQLGKKYWSEFKQNRGAG